MRLFISFILFILTVTPLYAVVITRNGCVSGFRPAVVLSAEQMKNLKLGRQPGPESLKRQQLEQKYPWLVSIVDFRKEVLRIEDCFSRVSFEKDAWAEFEPLLKSLMEYSEVSPLSLLLQKCSAIKMFCRYPFVDDNETRLIKADFAGRKDCVRYISKFVDVYLLSDVECLADWIAGARYLPEDDESMKKEFLKAAEKDRELFRHLPLGISTKEKDPFGELKNFGPEWKRTEEKFKFRKIYNKNLADFRTFVFVTLREGILKGQRSMTSAGREKIWEEFCRRAKASDEEKAAAEKAVPAIVEPKKEPEPPEDIKVDVEF